MLASFLDIPYDVAMLEGYRHTPQYPGRSGIDASRAEPSDGTEIPTATCPQSLARYDDLMEARAQP